MIVTLLTDFGLADAYVAEMKGVVLSLAPDACLVDTCHEVARHDIRAGAWTLGQYWSRFPAGTIHVAVVDPGVGTDREALLVEADGHHFVAPDNGLLSWVLKGARRVHLRRLKPSVHLPGPLSATFHGRDVFAYAAGLLAGGQALPEDIAEPVKSVHMPSWAAVYAQDGALVGEVVHVDRFGNLITNLSRRQIEETVGKPFSIHAGSYEDIRQCRTYGDAKEGDLIALFTAADTLEIAISGGSAAQNTPLRRGTQVVVRARAVE